MGIKALDDNTLEFTLKASCPYFIDLVSMWVYFPVQQATIEANGDKWTASAEAYVSNGPFNLRFQTGKITGRNGSHTVHFAALISSQRRGGIQNIAEGRRSDFGLSSTADVEGAKAALAEAGYPDGEGFPTLQLSFYSDSCMPAGRLPEPHC